MNLRLPVLDAVNITNSTGGDVGSVCFIGIYVHGKLEVRMYAYQDISEYKLPFSFNPDPDHVPVI